ncbi:hypothetical protein GYA19_04195, partial [Candidatus Beckwithbacteria bacterium]|nr:hypothetical protein [Candidatus Beckwithbacteria bacterium]
MNFRNFFIISSLSLLLIFSLAPKIYQHFAKVLGESTATNSALGKILQVFD